MRVPVHANKLLPTNTSFSRKHLASNYHDAYLCTCNGFCCGSQFYCRSRPTQEKVYTAEHKQPYAVGLQQKTLTPCRICDACHKDLSSDKTLGLSLCRRFSSRNGFGPIPSAIRGSAQFELDCALDAATAAEEAAIRQIVPLQSTVPITVSYLQSLGEPVARVDATYSFSRKNHAAKEVNLPRRNALVVSAIVMLLVNFVVEEDLFNGAVGKIVQICYADPDGPRKPGAQPDYVVVDFPGHSIPIESTWDRDHPTHVPVPCVTMRCEKDCCSMTTIPLRVCKAITTYKTQGLTVGDEQVWKKLVVHLASLSSPSPPGSEQVAVSRATSLDCLAFLQTEEAPLTFERLMKIGTGPSYKVRQEFEKHLREMQELSQKVIIEKVQQMDPNREAPTFEGGYSALVDWYRDSTS